MDNLIVNCTDGSCCCLPPRSTVALISALSMIVCSVDVLTVDWNCDFSSVKSHVDSMRYILTVLFQLANLLLLAAAVLETPYLLSMYICYTLGFILMGLLVSLLDLLFQFKYGAVGGIVSFVVNVVFLFVISRCLPLVESYRRNLFLDDYLNR